MKPMKFFCMLTLLLAMASTTAFAQTTGKIAGFVTDASTGELLPGVNVAIDGTTRGAVSDAEGFYFINNVRPGTYVLRASFIGFIPVELAGVRVSNGLTTNQDFALQTEAVGLDEVTVTAERAIVQLDVSANVASLDPAEFEDLPVAGVSEVLDLQAGIEPGLQVRGGGLSELAFIVDGVNLRTGRAHQPFTNISYTALEEVQVQTGGFGAEYGNVRAGVVNVSTKEPPRDRYIFDGMFRMAPAQDKSFNALGGNVENCDFNVSEADLDSDCGNWFARPALDPAVAFSGTEGGGWDTYTQRQYNAFEGWDANAIVQQTKGFDVTAQDMQDHFIYTHRKDNAIDIPDYEADMTIGGPLIPGGAGAAIGDPRFLVSYRGTQTAYTLPQTRDSFKDQVFSGKLMLNPAKGMKFTVHGFTATERGMNRNSDISDVQPWKGNLPIYPWSSVGAQPVEGISRRGVFMYSDAKLARADIDHAMVGASFVHTLNSNTFYEINVTNIASKYRSRFPNTRDGAYEDENGVWIADLWTDNAGVVEPDHLDKIGNGVTCFGGTSDLNGDGIVRGYCAGTEPLGFAGFGGNLPTGETTGGHWNKTRDTTDVSVLTGRFDLTSQLNRFLQIKTGAELIFSDYSMHFGRVNLALVGPEPENDVPYDRSPIQGAAYATTKLEFKGMIANLGFRMDYFDPNVDWWVYDPYTTVFRDRVDALDEQLEKEPADAQVFLSPRLGISFPISDNSKVYFNYSHARQMLDPLQSFGLTQSLSGGINNIGNPAHPMPNTVSYELGFDQNVFDQFLLRISGFYRDIQEQPRGVTYTTLGNVASYQIFEPWNYEDVRGIELTLSKNRGRFLRGFVNYTFLQTKSGNFGYQQFRENSFEMRNYLRQSTDYRQNSPIAQPFARASIQLLSPDDLGPEMGGFHPLGDWRIAFLGEWRSGQKWIWQGGGGTFRELQENTAWSDYLNFDMRFTKHFDTPVANLQLFLDLDNVFNIKRLYSNAAFHPDGMDFEEYMWSLHLPEDTFEQLNDQENLPYVWIPGNDKPGDFRKPGVAFQPIVEVKNLDGVEGDDTAWWWDQSSGNYFQWNGTDFTAVPQGEVDQVLSDKAYIDMPNLGFNTFLNPRRVTLGLRIQL